MERKQKGRALKKPCSSVSTFHINSDQQVGLTLGFSDMLIGMKPHYSGGTSDPPIRESVRSALLRVHHDAQNDDFFF